MTASFEERLLPIVIMLIAGLVSAFIPLYALGRRRLDLQRDIIFIFFWFQSWIYLHLVPTLNVMFPESAFAFPAGYEDIRAVRFSEQVCWWYAFFQAACLALFYAPMILVYRAWIGARRQTPDAGRAGLGEGRISHLRLLALGLFYSAFSVAAVYVAWQNNYLSSYADVMTIDTLLGGGLAGWQYYLYRLYLLGSMFMTIVVAVSLWEYCRRDPPVSRAVIYAALPGLICQAVWILCRSRALLVFTIGLIAMVLVRRGIMTIPRRKAAMAGMLALGALYLFSVIIKLRAYVLVPEFSWNFVRDALNPFYAGEDSRLFLASNYGLRLDGLEMMALTFPQMLEKGLLLGKSYVFSILSPLLNFMPDLKLQLLQVQGMVDVRMEFIREYAGLEFADYAMNGLTDIYAATGLIGFCVAGVVYALLFVFISRRLAPRRSGVSFIIAIFILCQVYSFEVAFATLPFGWIRSLPVLLAVLLIYPRRAADNLRG
jgi:hypothetical protein